MGIFDFLFRKKKDTSTGQGNKPLESKSETEPKINGTASSRKSEVQLTIEPFVFKSDCHQRFENGLEVMGLQHCGRIVSVEKNTNGCRGYKLTPGDGYIVKVFNDDAGKPNMSDKPMRIISKSVNKIELRGFPIEAQTPFGWQEVDYRDYGLTVYYTNGKVSKCVLHMFDRNVDLEYRKSSSSSYPNKSDSGQPAVVVKEKLQFEILAQEAMAQLQRGNDGDAVYHPMYKAWREIQRNPSSLKDVQNKALLGNALYVFFSYGTVQDIDDRQQILSLAYLLISDAIKENPEDMNLIKSRLLIMLQDREAFQYTVSRSIRGGSSFDLMGMSMSPVKSRDALHRMIYSDLKKSPLLRRVGIFNATLNDLENKIDSQFFGVNKTRETLVEEGIENHEKVFTHLEEMVYTNGDIDF